VLKRAALTTLIAALALVASTSSASASITIGGMVPGGTPASNCSNVKDDWVQPTVATGSPYVIPSTGTITSWSTNTSSTPGQVWTLKVFQRISGSTYKALAHDGPRPLTSSQINTFKTSIPVKPGDLVGMNDNDTSTPASTTCAYVSTGNTLYFGGGSLADNQQGPIASAIADRRLNIEAVFEPTNRFTMTQVARKQGTAIITLDLPNAGELTASGVGVRAIPQAVAGTSVNAGQTQLLVSATGRKRRKLRRTGKVKLNVAITYTPTGGAARVQHAKLRLRKQRPKPALRK
jgi:hypothetical protein